MNGRATHSAATPRILRPWQTAALVILLVAALGAIYSGTRTRSAVRVVSPSYQDLASSISTTGVVIAEHDFPARANFSGVVEKIYVHLGQKVRAGQMLIRMKDQYAVPRLESAKAALDEAQLTADNVEHNGSQEDRIVMSADLVRAQTEQTQASQALQAMQKIAARGSVSHAELEAARERLRVANATLDALKQRLTARYSPEDVQSWKDRVAADKAALAAERVSWANANIASPFAGTVYLLPTRLYDFVPAGADLMHVADLSRTEVQADFEGTDLGKIHVGQPVRITWEGQPGRVWEGHVVAKPLAVTSIGARSVGRCTIAFDHAHSDIPINTAVALEAIVERRTHVLAIPREALRSEGAEHYVYCVRNGELERIRVETGLVSAMSIEITRGLSPEDAVVLYAVNDQKLADHQRVSVER